jgi:hypothetical protein
MPSASGYPGVRRHEKNWQAKDAKGVYGTFADPYDAACALSTAQGKPTPGRRPDTVEYDKDTQQHTAALTAVMFTVPAAQMITVLTNALLAVEQRRAQQSIIPDHQAVAVAAAVNPDRQYAVVVASPPTASQQGRANRGKTIADWWRSLWTSSKTDPLTTFKSPLLHHYDKVGHELMPQNEEHTGTLRDRPC